MKTKFKEIQNSLIQLFKNKVFILVIILIAADLLLGAYSRALISRLPEQAEGQRWSDGRKMTQVSAFFYRRPAYRFGLHKKA
jgi:hypothetical protein